MKHIVVICFHTTNNYNEIILIWSKKKTKYVNVQHVFALSN